MVIREFNGKTPNVEKALFIAENASIIGDVTLDEGVTIWYGAVLRADTGAIRVGKNVNIQDGTVLHTEVGGDVNIADNVTIGHKAIVHGCSIGSNTMIGMGATVMNDAVIGKDSLVAAGSLVTERKEFPEGSLIMGSPAKAVKKTSEDQIKMIKSSVQEYLDLGKAYKNIEKFDYSKYGH